MDLEISISFNFERGGLKSRGAFTWRMGDPESQERKIFQARAGADRRSGPFSMGSAFYRGRHPLHGWGGDPLTDGTSIG
ncbi:hypothetical protein Taro_006338 [Colocasia esculenta]|uniref:Uncharacterized protein n=1 Tax=Colocasia esculenta TaxID=4460 RepID=A0A843TS68_COLES|nr:hypothetical protein [Colocasia esculenta]